jgi:hypothetical protein
VEANDHHCEAKCAGLLGPEQNQIEGYAQDDEVYDILPTKGMYGQHELDF